MKRLTACYKYLFPGLLIAISAEAANPANTGLFASANTAETAYINPAGMVRLNETSHTLQGIFVHTFIEFDVDESRTSVNGGDPDKDNTPIIIPGFYYVKPLNDDWRFGFSMNIPSGFGSDYGNDWAGRYYTDNYTLVFVGVTPSVAYRIDEHWSVGASLNATYTYTESEVAINNPGPNEPDGKLKYDGDDIAYTGTISMLYQWNDQTRLGISYTGETESKVEGDIKLKRLGPLLDRTLSKLDGKSLKVDTIMPQRLQAGIYHQFDSGRFMTVDALWIDFSEFGTGDISIEDARIVHPEGIYNDIWGLTFGMGFPIDAQTTWKFGAIYLSKGVDDDKRTMALRLDRIWGLGVGISRKLKNSSLDVNFNLYNTGDASVDTGTSNRLRGQVVGESDTPYAIAADIAWHW